MLPDGWMLATVGEACETVSVGIVVNPSTYYVAAGEGIRAFRSGNVRENRVNDAKWVFLSEDGNRKNKKSILRAGDVLVVRTGFAGTACVVPCEYEGSNCIDILFARPLPGKLTPEYLCQLTNSELGRKQVLSGRNGLAQKHLNVSSYKKMQFGLPSVDEQRRIASALGVWDQAIAATENLIANSTRQKRNLIALLFLPSRRDGRSSSQWSTADFDALFERVVRKNTSGNSNVLTISGQQGLVAQGDYFNKSVASANLSGYTLLRKGEFAYNKSYSAGYPMGAIKPLEKYEAGVVSSLYICFRFREGVEADPDFFRHYFEAGLLDEEISGIAQEGARNHGLLNVGIRDFFKLRLHFPNVQEQRRIAQVINAAEQEEHLMTGHAHKLKLEKRALMQQLLTGKRRLRVPASEAA